MMESINKNVEIVGVSSSLKNLASKKLPTLDSINTTPPLMKQSNVEEDANTAATIMDNKVTINHPSPSSNDENGKIVNDVEYNTTPTCGWYKFRPKYLQRFMSPKWTLCFLCLAGATQGDDEYTQKCINLIHKHTHTIIISS